MAHKYTAILYFDADEIASLNGEDADELYSWMLIKAQGKFGNFNGKIVENETGKIIRKFRHSSPD